ncbi:hypothetical protein I4U23_002865 [Adineta vaga]|nr:hypothetical protein I4U23_002865 [Adineta vaga]
MEQNLLSILVLICILIFSIIHVTVNIITISKSYNYGDILRLQKGVFIDNIMIGCLGILISGFGLFSILAYHRMLSKIVVAFSFLLGILTIVSIIIVLILQARSSNYVKTHFLNHMNQYKANQNARVLLNYIQMKHECCGDGNWSDWSHISLKTLSSSSFETHLRTIVKKTHQESSTSLGIYLPPSCCTQLGTLIKYSSNLYCLSNAHNLPNGFYKDGCSKRINKIINIYSIFIIIINSFLTILSFLLIPLLLRIYSNSIHRKTVVIHQLPQDYLWHPSSLKEYYASPVPWFPYKQ